MTAAAAADAGAASRPSLAGLTRAGLAERLAEAGVPERELRMRTGQLWHWLYVRARPGSTR